MYYLTQSCRVIDYFLVLCCFFNLVGVVAEILRLCRAALRCVVLESEVEVEVQVDPVA